MEELSHIYGAFNWFISMTVFNVLHPIMPFSIIVPLLLMLLPFALRSPSKIKITLATLPIFWVITGLAGAVFQDRGPLDSYEHIGNLITGIAFLLFILFSGFCFYSNKGFRWRTCLFVIINLYFILFMSLISGMSISGTWL